jgi:replicative DNA helicase
VQEKVPVGIFSLEMSRDQITDRLIALEAGVSLWRLRTGKLVNEGDVDELALVYEASERLKTAPIFVDDSPALTDLQIRTMSRKLKHEIGGLGLIIIDYLQLIRSSKHIDNRVQEVSEISKNLKELARELEVPVLSISQLSREPEKRISSIPKLSDLRESGSIEQDSDVVLFIHRPKEGMANLPSNQVNIIIAKHRNGPVGSVDLYFDPETVSFYSVEEEMAEMEYH